MDWRFERIDAEQLCQTAARGELVRPLGGDAEAAF